jgi:hypothetical protein
MDAPTVEVAGGFWAKSDDGRRHRVTARRVVRRSPCGRWFRAYTRLSLPGGGDVWRVRGWLYRGDRVGTLVRLDPPVPAPGRRPSPQVLPLLAG